jgi:hypothetical protein
MFERATTFWRPNVSDNHCASGPPAAGGRESLDGLTRPQARALSRCEPLTPAEFKARRRVADQGLVSLSGVLHEGAQARSR